MKRTSVTPEMKEDVLEAIMNVKEFPAYFNYEYVTHYRAATKDKEAGYMDIPEVDENRIHEGLEVMLDKVINNYHSGQTVAERMGRYNLQEEIDVERLLLEEVLREYTSFFIDTYGFHPSNIEVDDNIEESFSTIKMSNDKSVSENVHFNVIINNEFMKLFMGFLMAEYNVAEYRTLPTYDYINDRVNEMITEYCMTVKIQNCEQEVRQTIVAMISSIRSLVTSKSNSLLESIYPTVLSYPLF